MHIQKYNIKYFLYLTIVFIGSFSANLFINDSYVNDVYAENNNETKTFTVNVSNKQKKALNSLLSKLHLVFTVITAIGIIAAIPRFVKACIMLGASSNSKNVQNAYSELLKCFISTACLAAGPTITTIMMMILL